MHKVTEVMELATVCKIKVSKVVKSEKTAESDKRFQIGLSTEYSQKVYSGKGVESGTVHRAENTHSSPIAESG